MMSNIQMKSDDESNKASRVDLNVGGTIFAVDTSTIMQYPDTMLGAMLSERWTKENTKADEEICLDRDPVLFRHILSFYRDGRLVIPHTITKAEMFGEIEYFSLPLQEEDIQYDTSSIADMRKTILEFENHYIKTVKKAARESAMVACANELAVMLFNKIRTSPDSEESVAVEFNEIPSRTVADLMFYDVVDDELFQGIIQSIVEKVGYTFDGEISSNSVRMKRM